MRYSLKQAVAALLVAVLFIPASAGAQGLTLTTDSEEAKEAFLEALFLQQNSDREQAIQAYARALDADPDFLAAQAMKLRTDRTHSVVERYEMMGEFIAPLSQASVAELLLVLGYREWLSGEIDGDYTKANRTANQIFAALRAVAPESPQAAHAYAVSRVDWVFHEDQTMAYAEVIERFPDYPPAHNLYAYRLAWSGDMSGAREEVTRFLELAPETANAYDSYGEIMQWSGLLDVALTHYREAIAMGRWDSNEQVANALYLKGDSEGARETLRRMVEEASNERDKLPPLRALAATLMLDGKIAEGMAAWERVAEVAAAGEFRGFESFAHTELALLDAMFGDGSKVDFHFQKSLEVQPSRDISWYQVWAYAITGRLDEAREAAAVNQTNWPEDREAAAMLSGVVQLYEGNLDDATVSLLASNIANAWAKAPLAVAYRIAGNEVDGNTLENQVLNDHMLQLSNSNNVLPRLLVMHMNPPEGTN